MINVKRILNPTDFSDFSGEATKYAIDFAQQFDAELHLLHVIREFAALLPVPIAEAASSLENYDEESELRALESLNKLLDSAGKSGRHVTIATRHGSPFVEIIDYAREHEIDLIVMGTHGRSALPHALIGSVAERVVRKAPCPVLTVRPAKHQFVAL